MMQSLNLFKKKKNRIQKIYITVAEKAKCQVSVKLKKSDFLFFIYEIIFTYSIKSS